MGAPAARDDNGNFTTPTTNRPLRDAPLLDVITPLEHKANRYNVKGFASDFFSDKSDNVFPTNGKPPTTPNPTKFPNDRIWDNIHGKFNNVDAFAEGILAKVRQMCSKHDQNLEILYSKIATETTANCNQLDFRYTTKLEDLALKLDALKNDTSRILDKPIISLINLICWTQ